MSLIHPLAHVDPAATLGANVRVGPFCAIGAGVVIGDDCELLSHVCVYGPTTIGRRNRFFPNCVIGVEPQDLKYRGGPTAVHIGDDNVFRESVTVHRGTEVDRVSGGVTRIGNHNLLMVGVHVAHDVDICDHIIIANQVQLAGHIRIEDCANIGGATAIHHFVTIGRYAFVAGMTRATHDVPPFMRVAGYEQEVRGVNHPGMRRWRIPGESIQNVKRAWRLLYSRRTGRSPGRTSEALSEIERVGLLSDPYVAELVEFLQRKLAIGIYGRIREHSRNDTEADRDGFYRAASNAEQPA